MLLFFFCFFLFVFFCFFSSCLVCLFVLLLKYRENGFRVATLRMLEPNIYFRLRCIPFPVLPSRDNVQLVQCNASSPPPPPPLGKILATLGELTEFRVTFLWRHAEEEDDEEEVMRARGD